MNFLHLLANLDAYHALLDVEEERPPSKSTVVKFAPDPASRQKSATGLRPSSVLSVQDSPCNGIPDIRLKSGKSLTFQLAPGRHTPALSVSTAEFKFISGRELRTPISATRIVRSPDVYASGRTTVLSSIREGARSPTPNALKDMEVAFHDIDPDMYGLTIWRIQGSRLHTLDDNEYGFFHEGNAYIILNIESIYRRTLHYWIGSLATETEAKLAEDKAHQLDQIIANAHVFSREVQNHESTLFLRLFNEGVVYIEGKHKQGVSKSARYEKRLYLVTGRKHARASCMFPKREYIQSTNILILDGFPRIYVWIGKHSGYVLKNKAIKLARKLQIHQRYGRCHLVVIDENDTSLSEAFRRKFDDPPFPVIPKLENGENGEDSSNGEKDKEIHMLLHRVSGDRVLYDMPEASKRPLNHCYLVRRDSYLLDRGSDSSMYVWVGSAAMEDEVNHAITRAKSFSQHNNYLPNSPICRIREEHEPIEFKRCFCDWRDKLSKEMSVTKRYSAGNIGRALFSRSDRRTIATVSECWSEDTVGEHRRKTQVWVLNNGGLEDWEHVGLFTNNKCFLVLHTTIEVSHYQYVIYYWLGSKAPSEDKETIVQSAVKKNNELENTAVLIRVLDGKEPQHFMTALENWILVYDGDETVKEQTGVKMFCVRDSSERATRIQQVCPSWVNLNSSASFAILAEPGAFLWYGKLSGSTEREAAKELLGILCSAKMYSPEVVTEGKESCSLSHFIGKRQPYENEYKTKVLERRPPCLIYCHPDNKHFESIDNFLQEDLSEEDVFILDTFDQAFLWCGERVDESRRKELFKTAKRYIEVDPAARELDTVSVWVVSQRSEPVAFSKHFASWNALGYSGRHSYEVLRKRVRQENARIDINENMVDTTFLSQPKYPYKVLVKKELPQDVDDTNKHNHLSERQFRENLKTSRLEFYRFPVWKQRQILRSAFLLYVPCDAR